MNQGEFFEDLFRCSPYATSVHTLVLDEQGRPCDYIFDLVNPAFETLTGLSGPEILGKTVLSVLPSTEVVWVERYGQVALTGVADHFESYSQALEKWFQVSAFRHKPLGFCVTFIDITDRVLEGLRANREHEKYRSFFDLGAAKLVHSTATGKILEANQKASDYYGYPLDLLKTLNIESLHPGLPLVPPSHVYLALHRADGQVRDVEVFSSPGVWEETEAQFSQVFDITEANLLRKTVAHNERLSAIGAMTASLYHEFGNLLGVISSQFQLLDLMVPETEGGRRLSQNIQSQFRRSHRLVASIKRLAQSQDLSREEYRLGQVLEDIIELGAPLCREQQIEVYYRFEDGDRVEIDVALIQQVFLNIFKNAIQALMGVSQPRIDVELRVEESHVVVRMGNNGASIPLEVRPKIFSPFYTTKKQGDEPGTGLGLSFSASVLRGHGGELILEDGPQTVFQIRIPVLSP